MTTEAVEMHGAILACHEVKKNVTILYSPTCIPDSYPGNP